MCCGRPRADARHRALDLLAQVGLSDKADDYPGGALRRPAAARRHRPRAGDGPQGDAVRRGDQRARSGAGLRGADGDARPRRARHDHAGRHARDELRPPGRVARHLHGPRPDRRRRRSRRRSSAPRASRARAISCVRSWNVRQGRYTPRSELEQLVSRHLDPDIDQIFLDPGVEWAPWAGQGSCR